MAGELTLVLRMLRVQLELFSFFPSQPSEDHRSQSSEEGEMRSPLFEVKGPY
jgi:hypothetical protein